MQTSNSSDVRSYPTQRSRRQYDYKKGGRDSNWGTAGNISDAIDRENASFGDSSPICNIFQENMLQKHNIVNKIIGLSLLLTIHPYNTFGEYNNRLTFYLKLWTERGHVI